MNWSREFSSCVSLARGGDPHDVSLEHVAELVDLEDQLEGLVPGNVLQAHRDRSADVRVEHDVELRQLAEPLQRVLDVRVLEVQRDRLARVLLVAGAERAGLVGIRDLARARGAVLLDEKSLGRLDQGLVLGRARLSCDEARRTADLDGSGGRPRRGGLTSWTSGDACTRCGASDFGDGSHGDRGRRTGRGAPEPGRAPSIPRRQRPSGPPRCRGRALRSEVVTSSARPSLTTGSFGSSTSCFS